MTSVDGCADSTSEGKAYDAKLAGSPAGMLELPRATFKPNLGTAGGLLAAVPCMIPGNQQMSCCMVGSLLHCSTQRSLEPEIAFVTCQM